MYLHLISKTLFEATNIFLKYTYCMYIMHLTPNMNNGHILPDCCGRAHGGFFVPVNCDIFYDYPKIQNEIVNQNNDKYFQIEISCIIFFFSCFYNDFDCNLFLTTIRSHCVSGSNIIMHYFH